MTAYWDHPIEAPTISNYTIQWGTSRSFANNCDTSSNCEQHRVSGTTTDYIIPGLSNNRTYYVRIQGATSNGPGTWSLTESLRLTSDLQNPGAPRNVRLTTVAPGTTLQVTWEAPLINDNDPAATGYRVQWRNVSENESWSSTRRQASIDSGATLTHPIPNLESLDDYEVRVLAINDRVAGPWSSTARITLGVAGAPFDILPVPGSRSISLTWTNPGSSPDVDDIVLQWDTSSGFATDCDADASCNQRTLAGNDAEEPITGLTANTVYYIRLRAINDNGPGPWSETVSAEPGTLEAPGDLAAAEDAENIRSLDLTWSKADETGKPALSGFAIRWRTVGATSWSSSRNLTLVQAGSEDTDCTNYCYTLTNLNSGVEYEVQILSRNSYGNGPWSTTAESSPPNVATPGQSFIPTSVTISTATDTNNNLITTLEVSWSLSTSLTINSYYVQWRTCGTSGYSCGGWGTAQTIRPDVNDNLATSSQFPATSLREGTVYYQARVRANGASASGGNSAFAESPRYHVTIEDPNDTPSDRTDDTVTIDTGQTINP